MIKEDFVSFETAKLLKEKGFNELCRYYYEPNMSFTEVDRRYVSSLRNSTIDYGFERFKDRCVAPTLQMAMKWLREEIGIYIEIRRSLNTFLYKYRIEDSKLNLVEVDATFMTYNAAVEAALKYCLTILI